MKNKRHFLPSLLITGLLLANAAFVSQAVSAPELSSATYNVINKSSELLAEDKISEALSKLTKHLQKVKKRKYDRAVTHQQIGAAYAQQDKLSKAAEHFAAALKDDALPLPAAQRLRYNLAQIQAANEKFSNSANLLQKWLKIRESNAELKKERIPSRLWILLANNYFQQKQYKSVLQPAKNAIAAESRPQESWYLMLFQSQYELKRYKGASQTLEKVIKLNPNKKQYWINLYSLSIERKDEAKALAVLRSAHAKGLFKDASDYRRLSDFLAYRKIPFEAAQIYQEGLDNGTIAKDVKSLKKLANYWALARENKKAINMYRQALTQQADPKLQMKVAGLQNQIDDHQGVVNTLNKLAPGMTSKDQGKALFLKGIAHYNLGNMKQSLSLLKKAAKNPDSKRLAQPWLAFINEEMKRVAEANTPKDEAAEATESNESSQATDEAQQAATS